jgi:SAM-dependent methyltransferase
MGLNPNVLRALIRESARKPFSGKAVTFGRQTMGTTIAETFEMFAALGRSPALEEHSQIGIDETTTSAIREPDARTIRDIDFFRILGLSEVHAIDISSFEGADIILNLNQPIPDDIEASFDLVVDGSVLDNIFDTTSGLRNAARLLAPGGRCYLNNLGNSRDGYTGIPYTMFNPFWFFDYFVYNQFDYCQVYVTINEDREFEPAVYAISLEHAARRWGRGFTKPIVSTDLVALSVYAEKGARSTWDRTPTQHVYRDEHEWADYIATVAGYLNQRRQYLQWGKAGTIPREIPEGYMRIWPDGSAAYTGLTDAE